MGRKIVKGESSQNVKRLGPLTTAYLRVFQAKKKTLGLQASTAPLIHREMTAGMNYEIQQDTVTSEAESVQKVPIGSTGEHGMFKNSHPCFFANNVNLVLKKEHWKVEKVHEAVGKSPTAYLYVKSAGIVDNELDAAGYYHPDLLGRKMHPKQMIVTGYLGETVEKMEDILNANISNKLTHRYLSLICKEAGVKQDKEAEQSLLWKSIVGYVDHLNLFASTEPSADAQRDALVSSNQILMELQSQKYSFSKQLEQNQVSAAIRKIDNLNEAKFAAEVKSNRLALVKKLFGLIANMATKGNSFRHYSTSHDSINTSDYVISVCGTRHEFTPEDNAFGLVVHKNMIFASVKNTSKTPQPLSHIPVCEELVIQYRKLDGKTSKDCPTLVNDSACLVISYAIDSSHEQMNVSTLHCFGSDAFSVVFGADDVLIQDKTKSCTRMAGALCKKLIDIHSSDAGKASRATTYWNGMFDAGNYKDTTTMGTLRDLLVKRGTTLQATQSHGALVVNAGTIPGDPGGDSAEKTMQNLSEAEASLAAAHTANSAKISVKSFLTRQAARDWVKVKEGHCCQIRCCRSSPSFSITAFTPAPGVNVVFILTGLNKAREDHKGSLSVTHGPTFGSSMETGLETEPKKTARFRSKFDLERELEFDLERELDLIKAA